MESLLTGMLMIFLGSWVTASKDDQMAAPILLEGLQRLRVHGMSDGSIPKSSIALPPVMTCKITK